MGVLRMHTAEKVIPNRRLGRHVNHDPRSRKFTAPVGDIKTVMWERHVPIFNQGDLGSCTGNAAVGCVSSGPFSVKGDEALAIKVYSRATHIDHIRGVYPPTDTGSSGLAVCRALVALGMIQGYTHAFGFEHVAGALQIGPGITGITWLTGCDEPDTDGIVTYDGDVRGGHEVELVGLDADAKLVWFANSWGASWGKDGYFAMSWDDYLIALQNRGDATFPTVPNP